MEFHPYFTHKKWTRLGQNESNRYKRKNPGNAVFPGLSGTFLMKLALGESNKGFSHSVTDGAKPAISMDTGC